MDDFLEIYVQNLLSDCNRKAVKRGNGTLEDNADPTNKRLGVNQDLVNKLCLDVVVEKMLPLDTVSCESFKQLIKGWLIRYAITLKLETNTYVRIIFPGLYIFCSIL